jgi:hypothetical protein
MNMEALFLFLILLLGLVLCSFLGGNCGKEGMTGNTSSSINADKNSRSNNSSSSNNSNSMTSSNNKFDNYNHFSGTSTSLTNGATFYGANGGTVVVSTDSNGKQTLQVKLSSNENAITFNVKDSSTSSPSSMKPKSEGYTNYYGSNGSATTFYGPNGESATVIYTNDGQQAINIQTSNGSYTFTQSGSVYNPNNTSSTQYYGSTGSPIQTGTSNTSYTGAYGGSAGSVTGPGGNTAYYAQGPGGNTVAGTTTNSNNYDPYYNGTSSTQYYGPYGGQAGSVSGPAGNTAYYAQGPAGNTVAGTSSNGYDYSNSLPSGIPRSQIPPGQEDLYILKSEIVPPVCPVCPIAAACPRQEPCPACPACARCPEPSFECKKVPNYNAINDSYLPQPVVNDFSTFGM